MMTRGRVTAAFLLAPLLVPFVFLIPSFFAGRLTGSSFNENVLAFLAYSAYLLVIGYAVEAVLGLPAWMVFRHYGIRSLFAFAGAGALIGWLLYLAILAMGS